MDILLLGIHLQIAAKRDQTPIFETAKLLFGANPVQRVRRQRHTDWNFNQDV